MLNHPSLDKLRGLRLIGMTNALSEQLNTPDIQTLDFDERFALLVDQEMTERHNRRLQTRLKQARFPQHASIEDIDFKTPRALDKALLLTLSQCQWIEQHHNCLIIGPTGVGKSWIAIALAHKACREGYTAHYLRLPRITQQLLIAKGDGSYSKWMKQLARIDVIILDDLGAGAFG